MRRDAECFASSPQNIFASFRLHATYFLFSGERTCTYEADVRRKRNRATACTFDGICILLNSSAATQDEVSRTCKTDYLFCGTHFRPGLILSACAVAVTVVGLSDVRNSEEGAPTIIRAVQASPKRQGLQTENVVEHTSRRQSHQVNVRHFLRGCAGRADRACSAHLAS